MKEAKALVDSAPSTVKEGVPKEEAGKIKAGQALEVDPGAGEIVLVDDGKRLACAPIPAHLLAMIADGGLLAHLEKKLKGAPA